MNEIELLKEISLKLSALAWVMFFLAVSIIYVIKNK